MIAPHRSLRRYAFTIAGPRDFLINLAINSFIPWWLLRDQTAVGWFGDPSVMSLWGPMGFLLVFFTTFFGYSNGVAQRQKGLWGLPLAAGWWWLPIALWSAFVRGLIGMFVMMLAVIGLAVVLGPIGITHFPPMAMIVTQGVFAGGLAFGVQVAGIRKAEQLADPPP